jgi:hypothetical protein
MGKITNVLNKVQESRQELLERDISDLFDVKEPPKDNSKIILFVCITAALIAAILIGYGFYQLEKTIKKQEKKTAELAVLLTGTKAMLNDRIQDLDSRFKVEAQDRKAEINKLSLVDNVYYIDLMKAIIADKNQIDYLDSYTRYLKTKIEKKPAFL